MVGVRYKYNCNETHNLHTIYSYNLYSFPFYVRVVGNYISVRGVTGAITPREASEFFLIRSSVQVGHSFRNRQTNLLTTLFVVNKTTISVSPQNVKGLIPVFCWVWVQGYEPGYFFKNNLYTDMSLHNWLDVFI